MKSDFIRCTKNYSVCSERYYLASESLEVDGTAHNVIDTGECPSDHFPVISNSHHAVSEVLPLMWPGHIAKSHRRPVLLQVKLTLKERRGYPGGRLFGWLFLIAVDPQAYLGSAVNYRCLCH